MKNIMTFGYTIKNESFTQDKFIIRNFPKIPALYFSI